MSGPGPSHGLSLSYRLIFAHYSIPRQHWWHDELGWTPVEPVEGALVVNAGDLMHILTNGRFKSLLHRAMVNNTAYFYGRPKDAKVSPLKKLIEYDGNNPPLFHPVIWKEYLEAK
ncbi:Oxoglutarate/iron-dependent dioxygenase [Corchorus olitorius]|uniref:Oxoglutarate/iron-dependent dioxygenase n=1 Tax=Corchorus olitorius TaxID=93759 RepID=A0A1R3GIP3_9ROSI|nr:Oxoglutarate/iron-dependent dioxygenase [Corchorus olitorius]